MVSLKFRLTPFVLSLAVLWSTGAHALIIDSFDTDTALAVTSAAPGTDANVTGAGAGMIGTRTEVLSKTAGPSGGANGAFADVGGGVLAIANGPVTNSQLLLEWTFALTDLTEGGANTGIFLSLPSAIDNAMNITFQINGGTPLATLFPDGSSGSDFFIPFANFANSGDAATATSVAVVFSSPDLAWDAVVDFIQAGAPPEVPMAEPASLALFGLGLAGLGWTRRKQLS